MSDLQLGENDFSEMVIKYMARHPDVYRRCQQLHITGIDFVLDETYGNQIYKEFVDTIVNINGTPILQDTLMRHINCKIEDGTIDTAPWVTHRLTLGDLPRAFPTLLAPGSGVVKAVVMLPD